MEAVAIIPARGGSKRLPGKNLRPFAGVPLLAHSIWQAKHTSCLSRCVVSTDDPEIAEVGRKWGAEVVMRPDELANDDAKTGPVLQHALLEMIRHAPLPDAVVLLQPTNPLRPIAVIEEAVRRFERLNVDCVMTVTKSSHKLGRVVEGRFVPAYVPGTRSQDLESLYYENGVVYTSRARMILEQADVFGKNIVPLETEALYGSADIDTLTDFEIAEFLFHRYRNHFSAPEQDL